MPDSVLSTLTSSMMSWLHSLRLVFFLSEDNTCVPRIRGFLCHWQIYSFSAGLFFFLAHFKFSSSWSSMSWIPLCSIKISWVLVAKNMCYIMSNDTAPRTMGQRWKNWIRKKIIISLLLGGRKTLESVRIQLFIPSLCVCLKCRENTKQIGFQTTGELLVLQAVSVSSSTDK